MGRMEMDCLFSLRLLFILFMWFQRRGVVVDMGHALLRSGVIFVELYLSHFSRVVIDRVARGTQRNF